MNQRKSHYKGIDYFRIFAALLVVAIHTSPLSSFSETGDFILTRIIGRIAVPFFFMTSGFFLFSGDGEPSEKLKRFMKKTLILYIIAMILYIPINIYNSYFNADFILIKIIQDITFNGTLYHLWYFPAAIAGACLACQLIKRFGYKAAFGILAALYIVGLLGDSYYGLAIKLPLLQSFYSNIFQICDYTRNGIFFAPIFFALGAVIARRRVRKMPNALIGLFSISLALLVIEGLGLHQLNVQRHDSMYIMLIPCMYYLFLLLLCLKGSIKLPTRTISLVIYIVHPLMIIAVRMFGKIFGLEKYLINNSLIHYFTVLCLSTVTAILFTMVQTHTQCLKRKLISAAPKDRAWLEINLSNLKHNVGLLKNVMPGQCELMAVVKAEAYGHGSAIVSDYLNRVGISAFATATIDEAIQLRKHGITGDLLVLGYTHPSRAKELHKYRLTQTIIDYAYAMQLNKMGYHIEVHIKINTGMNRLGIDVQNVSEIKRVFKMNHLKVSGIYTHLCVSDSRLEDDIAFTEGQISLFYDLLEKLKHQGITLPKIHIQSSYGLLNYPNLSCDYVRIGISMYGTLSNAYDDTVIKLNLRPVLSLKSHIVLIREIKVGSGVGYGMTFIAKRKMKIAVLPVGYADGIPRSLSFNNGKVIINGKYAPIVGRICMDQLMVDITDIPDASTGCIATLIGKDGDSKIHMTEIAENVDSITNELLSRMGHRLNIVLK